MTVLAEDIIGGRQCFHKKVGYHSFAPLKREVLCLLLAWLCLLAFLAQASALLCRELLFSAEQVSEGRLAGSCC
jgi:hypothetical protein